MMDVEALLESPNLRGLQPYDQIIALGNRLQKVIDRKGLKTRVLRDDRTFEEKFRTFSPERQKAMVVSFALNCLMMEEIP